MDYEKKYIDADLLRKEIERRKEKWLAESRLIKKGKDKAMYAAGKSSGYTEFLSLVNSLQQEQPEVDLKEEIDRELDTRWKGEYLSTQKFRESARHFYELGLKAKEDER